MTPAVPTTRRRWLAQGLALSASGLASRSAWPRGITSGAAASFAVCQIVDVSLAQQDVSKDFLNGSRAAWQEFNSRGGLRGRRIQHVVLETDGSSSAVRDAVHAARDNPACVALTGSAGDPLARTVATRLSAEGIGLAHLAPWLQSSDFDADGRSFPVFASRLEQIAHALKTLSVMGVSEVGSIYPGPVEFSLYRSEVDRTCSALGLRATHFQAGNDLATVGQTLTPSTPAILLFLGGTPELVQFTQGMNAQTRQRYVIAMADVNLQTVQQMGAARHTPVIATQVVPVVNGSQPIVRSYRESLARLFDEPPTSLSLAGYISARVAFELLASADAKTTRAGVLAASQKPASLDVGGFRVTISNQRRTSAFVTQSMLTADGRVLG